MSVNDNTKFLENINQGFKRILPWNKYISALTSQSKNKNLDYLIHPIFRNINRLFVLLFKNGNDDATRNSFDKYYMSVEEIKDFNTLIDNTPFFDQPVKTKKKNRKLIEMSRNDAYRTGSLLDYFIIKNIINLSA